MSGYVHSLLGINESIIVRERRHWFVWLPQLLLSLFIMVVIIAASLLLRPDTNDLSLLGLVFLIIPIWTFVRVFLDWLTEEYIITSRRIIQSEGIINKSVIDSSLEKINDVTLSQSVMGRILDYGDLEILTASELGINKLRHIQSPVRFKKAMVNAKEALRTIGDIEDATNRGTSFSKNDIPELIAELDVLRQKGIITQTEFEEKRAKLLALL